MSFASDKLYNGYLRRKMPTIVSRVKVREIVIHLPCLTAHDRENIEAKRETCGNYDGMVLLLDCLKRRENWPEQFIEALEACEQDTIAAEIRAEYEALKGNNNSNPSSPPTTVVRAHVHPAPSASHLPVPESGGNSQAAVAPPAEAPPVPPEPAAQAPPILETPAEPEAPQITEAPKAVSPPEPVPEPPQLAQAEVPPPPPSTPPPSPETPHTEVIVAPLAQSEFNSYQEPEENSESDIQDVSVDTGGIPNQVSSGKVEVPDDDSVAPAEPQNLVTHSETDTPPPTDLPQTAITTEDRPPQSPPPQSPPPTEMNSSVSDGSSFLTLTPEKPPVQETTPEEDEAPAAVLQPEENSEPPAAQVVESSPLTEAAPTPSPEPEAAEVEASLPKDAPEVEAPPPDDSSVCLSKPTQLISIHPQNHVSDTTTIPPPSPPAEPYSGDSGRLEMSEAAPDDVTSDHVPACSPISSVVEDTVTALPCQENGIALNHNEPEENHYESPCQSADTSEVLEDIVHVCEVPSILNQDGQTSPLQIVNGEVAKETPCAPPSITITADETVLSLNPASADTCLPSDPPPADASPELKMELNSEKTAPRAPQTQSTNTKYILTAVGVGACALLMAWRFKN